MTRRKRYAQKGFFLTRSSLLYALIAVAVVVLGTGIYYRWHKTSSTPKQVVTNNGVATANPDVPGGGGQSASNNTGANSSKGDTSSSKQTASNTPGPSLSPNVQPTAPTGDFVSNHHPSLSSQNTETSTCTTTPGAYCQIRFTSGGITKVLPAEKTNASGSYYWDVWTLQGVGLTQGTWQITAVSINGDKTASTDGGQLVVSL